MTTVSPSRVGVAWVPLGVLAGIAALGLMSTLSPKVAIFWLLVVGLLFARQPVVLILAASTAFVHAFFARNSQVEYLMQDMWFTVDREVLLAIPMFLLAGALMTRGAIAQRLINVMIALTASSRAGWPWRRCSLAPYLLLFPGPRSSRCSPSARSYTRASSRPDTPAPSRSA
jgi:hypothetical protein